MDQRQAIKVIPLVYGFMMLLVCMVSYGGVDKPARTYTNDLGHMRCIECQKQIDVCNCACERCGTAFRFLKKSSGKGKAKSVRMCGDQEISLKGACRCHLDKDQEIYCTECVHRKETCICRQNERKRSHEDSGNEGATHCKPKKQKKSGQKISASFQFGSGADQIMQGEQWVPDLLQQIPTLDFYEDASSSSQTCVDEEDETEDGGSNDSISNVMGLVIATPVPASHLPVVQQLGAILAQFNALEPFVPKVVNSQAVTLFSRYGARAVIVPKGTAVDPRITWNLLIINDDGTIRLVLVLWNGKQWVFIFKNQEGETEVYVTDLSGYFSLQDELSISSHQGYAALTILTVMIAAPIPDLDLLWEIAMAAYQANHATLCGVAQRPPAIVQSSGYGSTTRRPAGIRIGAGHVSASQEICETFTEEFNEIELQEVVPHAVEALVMPDMALYFSNLLLTQGGSTLSAMGNYYELLHDITPENCLMSLEGAEFLFVITPPSTSEPPFIMFVSFCGATVTVNLIAIDINHQVADFASGGVSITVLNDEFWTAYASVMGDLPKEYRIRIFVRRYPDSDEEEVNDDDI